MAKCYATRNEFLTAVGTVNAELTMTRTKITYRTKYRQIAMRIESLGKAVGGRVLRTVTDDGTEVVSVAGLVASEWGGR